MLIEAQTPLLSRQPPTLLGYQHERTVKTSMRDTIGRNGGYYFVSGPTAKEAIELAREHNTTPQNVLVRALRELRTVGQLDEEEACIPRGVPVVRVRASRVESHTPPKIGNHPVILIFYVPEETYDLLEAGGKAMGMSPEELAKELLLSETKRYSGNHTPTQN